MILNEPRICIKKQCCDDLYYFRAVTGPSSPRLATRVLIPARRLARTGMRMTNMPEMAPSRVLLTVLRAKLSSNLNISV